MSTTTRKTYWEQLQDPKWQRKRLEIMQRDGFECKRCDSNEETLNVHHRWYEKGKKPWEYPDHALETLCKSCHETIEANLQDIRVASSFLTAEDMREVSGYIAGLLMIRGLWSGAPVPDGWWADGLSRHAPFVRQTDIAKLIKDRRENRVRAIDYRDLLEKGHDFMAGRNHAYRLIKRHGENAYEAALLEIIWFRGMAEEDGGDDAWDLANAARILLDMGFKRTRADVRIR